MDESAANTIQATSSDNYDLLGGEHNTVTAQFEVTNGVLLVGMRNSAKSSRYSAIDGIEVVPEPATMSLLSLGALSQFVRRRR